LCFTSCLGEGFSFTMTVEQTVPFEVKVEPSDEKMRKCAVPQQS
jgi:hypothetical protein